MSTAMRSVEVPPPVRQKLKDVRGRDVKLRVLAGVMTALAGFLAVMMGAMLIDWLFTLFSTSARTVLTLVSLVTGGILLVAWAIRPLLSRYRLQDVARDVDAALPQLEERWSTVTEIAQNEDPPEKRGAAAMIERVAREAADFNDTVTPEAVTPTDGVRHGAYILGGVSAALLLAVLLDWPQTSVLMQRFWMPAANISVTRVTSVTGDAIVGEGEPITLQAVVENRPQESALLFVRYENGERSDPVKLYPSKRDENAFEHEVPAVTESFAYRVRSGDGQTDWHKVTVVERPRIAAIDFRITPPAYSRLPEVHEQGLPHKIRVLEGGRLEASFESNTPLSTFEMKLGDDRAQLVKPRADGKYVFSTVLSEPLILSPILTSEYGLKNDSPPTCRVIVYRDRAPRVKVTTPDDEIAVRPDDTVTVEFAAKDDFGITKAELVVYEGHGPDAKELKVIEIPLGELEGAEEVTGEVPLDLKQFQLEQGTELSYSVRVFDTKQTMTDTGTPNDTTLADAATQTSPPQQLPAGGGDTPQPSRQLPPTADVTTPQAQVASDDTPERKTDPTGEPPVADGKPTQTDQPDGDAPSAKPPKVDAAKNDKPVGGKKSAADAEDATAKPGQSPEAGDKPPAGSEKPPAKPPALAQGEKDDARPKDDQRIAKNEQPGAQPKPGRSPKPNRDQPPGSSTGGSDNAQTAPPAKEDEQSPQRGQLAGAPKPDDDMTRRMLDVGQASTSKPLRLTIDEWAGSFAGQAREKLQLQIDPFLKQLDEHLAAAERLIKPLVAGNPDANWAAADAESAGRADQQLAGGEATILKLREKSVDTPYAFIGLQLINIGQEHVGPARDDLAAAIDEAADSRGQDLQQAQHHIRRARELVEQLNRKYETVKLNEKLDETMAQIKKMHEFFVEGTFALLQSKKPTLNPKSRKFLEFEMDEDFRKKFQELLERKRDIQAELAKALANDPRLLRRYMARTRLQADTLRDQLTILARRQEELNAELAAWAKAPDAERAELAKKHIHAWQVRSAGEIAEGTAQLLDNYVTWTPLDLDVGTGELAKMQEAATMMATTGRALADAASAGDLDKAREQAESLHRQLKEFQTRLPDVMNDHPEHDLLAVHVTNRQAEVKKLITQTSGWVYQANTVADGLYHLAADVEQNRIGIDTAHLAVKLEGLESWLAGMSDDLINGARQLFVTFDEELLPDLVNTQLSLQQNQLPRAVEQQSQVAKDFAKAEEQLDEIMDGMIKELDARPVDTKLTAEGELQTKTLEELLAMLEQEALAMETLGIPPRPNNINVEQDWLSPNSGGGGGGLGGAAMGQAQQAMQNLNRLQQDVRRANRRIKQTDGQNATRKNRRDRIRWNTLASELEEKLRQGRGHTPPEQYRRAIERYFETITKEQGDTAP